MALQLYLVFVLIALLAYVVQQSRKTLNYFKERGIPHYKAYPFIGSIGTVLFRKEGMPDFIIRLGKQFSNHKCFGFVSNKGPQLIVQDPDLIKEICVKEFDSFIDREPFSAAKQDELLSNAIFLLQGQKWRDMRSTLSPAFTSSKMRMMFEMVNDCARDFVDYFNERPEIRQTGRLNLEAKDIYSKFTVNVISTCAFGLKVDSLRQPKNDVYVNCLSALDFSKIRTQLIFMLNLHWK